MIGPYPLKVNKSRWAIINHEVYSSTGCYQVSRGERSIEDGFKALSYIGLERGWMY